MTYSVAELFCGGGMARLGLGDQFEVTYANDFSVKKANTYERYFGDRPDTRDLAQVVSEGPPVSSFDLVWASFPCQDWSEAGWKKGENGRTRAAYNAMIGFLDQVDTRVIVFENVRGLLTTDGGVGLARLARDLMGWGFNFTVHEINSVAWLPQSRPRVFVTAWKGDVKLPNTGALSASDKAIKILKTSEGSVPKEFFNVSLPHPGIEVPELVSLLEPVENVEWLPKEEVDTLIQSAKLPVGKWIDTTPRQEVSGHLREGEYGFVGTGFRRTRNEVVRFEPRFDGVAGCLRASEGGSSRQYVINIANSNVSIRRMTPREGARLMGIPDDYTLPKHSGSAWRLVGDGVCVPVVTHIRDNLILPILVCTK